MDRYPLKLTTVFGGRALAEKFGRGGLPEGRIGETWEVSDVEGMGCEVTNGPLAGLSLRLLVEEYPEELMGRGWHGEIFPRAHQVHRRRGYAPGTPARRRRDRAKARKPA